MRCPWATGEPLTGYHDREWGVPLGHDRDLFELLVLEGAQAGLSWLSVLRRREGYRRVFRSFDPEAVAAMSEADQVAALADPGIIRNRAKVAATVGNARALRDLQAADGPFSDYLWSWVEGRPEVNHWQSVDEVPVSTPLAHRLSIDLRRRGFAFVGPTIVYAYMQAAGLVMDHLTTCSRHDELADSKPLSLGTGARGLPDAGGLPARTPAVVTWSFRRGVEQSGSSSGS